MSMADDRLSLPRRNRFAVGGLAPGQRIAARQWRMERRRRQGTVGRAGGTGSDRSTSMPSGGIGCWRWGSACCCAAIAGPAVCIWPSARSTPPIRCSHCRCKRTRCFRATTCTSVDRDRFEIYKNTQQELLLSKLVLLSALRKPEVKDIPIVQYQDAIQRSGRVAGSSCRSLSRKRPR